MGTKTTDGTEILYKDWGKGQPVVLSHGWSLGTALCEARKELDAEGLSRCISRDG